MANAKGNVIWQKYFDVNNTILNEYLSVYGDDFFIGVTETIYDAILSELPATIIIEFLGADIVCAVSDTEYFDVLDKMLTLCEHLQKYELCSYIHDKSNKLRKLNEVYRQRKLADVNASEPVGETKTEINA